MKSLRIPLLAASFAALLPLSPQRAPAQEAAPAASPTPSALPEVTLVPEQVPEKKTPEAAEKKDKNKDEKSKTEQSAEDLLERIHYREAYTKARRDPKVEAEWQRSLKARTDLEKREALKSFYTMLHARIVAVDPTTKKTSDLRRTTSLHRLEQTRVDPTEPLDPQERAERFSRGSE